MTCPSSLPSHPQVGTFIKSCVEGGTDRVKCFEDAAGKYEETTGETINKADVQAKISRIAYEASQDSLKDAIQGCLATDGNTLSSCQSAAKDAYVKATGKTAADVDDTEYQIAKVEAGKSAVRNLIGACEDADKAACKMKAKKAFTDMGLPEGDFERESRRRPSYLKLERPRRRVKMRVSLPRNARNGWG